MIRRFVPQFDLFSVLIIAFTVLLIVTHKKKHPVRVTTQAIHLADEPIGEVELPADDPMNDDDPKGRDIRALGRAEQREFDELRARAAGLPVSELSWTPVDPGFVPARRARR